MTGTKLCPCGKIISANASRCAEHQGLTMNSAQKMEWIFFQLRQVAKGVSITAIDCPGDGTGYLDHFCTGDTCEEAHRYCGIGFQVGAEKLCCKLMADAVT